MATTRERVLGRAAAEIGVAEDPPKSNSVKYNQWYYGRDERALWCATFVSWCFFHENLPLPATTAKGFSFTPMGADWFRSNRRWVKRGERSPEPGWIVFYDFPNDKLNRISHVGIVEKANRDGSIVAIEGNTDAKGSRTGGQVMRKTRPASEIVGYGIPPYEEAAPPGSGGTRRTMTVQLPAWQYEEEDVKTKFFEIALDENGNGWTDWDPELGRDPILVGLVPHGPYPPIDGYWEDPAEDVTFRAQQRGNKIVVSAVNGEPRAKAHVFVSVA